MKLYLTIRFNFILFCLVFTSFTYSFNHPPKVTENISKAGANADELNKVISYYKNDPQKLEAAYFLIENMDCHNSQSYYWINEEGSSIDFNEMDYDNYEAAIVAFNTISSRDKLLPVTYINSDLETVKADYLIQNIEAAFIAWKSKWASKMPFDRFCEYILPYRIMDEPISDWRNSYSDCFITSFQKCENLNIRDACTKLTNDHKSWFANIFDYNIAREPQNVLSARQILFRRQGYCEDIANWGVFMLRTLGIASCVDYTPFWATSTGGHFWQAAIMENGNSIPFFMGDDTPAEFFMRREPSKVLRVTYSRQPDSPATHFPDSIIPNNFLRKKNYLDVTELYWKTENLSVELNPEYTEIPISYIAVLNGGRWRTVWWAKVNNGKSIFNKMTCGVVYLPIHYNGEKEIPASDPHLLYPDGSNIRLKANTSVLKTIRIPQKKNYLIFRPNARYALLYWDETGKWKQLAVKSPGKIINPDTELIFENVPTNALYILIPEYTQGKERPFTIDRNGNMNWW